MAWLSTPTVAIAFGAFILCAETCLHAGSIFREGWRELPLHDWAAGGFLLASGLASARDWAGRRHYQAAGWAFMSSLLVSALLGMLGEWNAPPDPDALIPERALIVVVAVMNAIAVGGLVTSLRRER